ncbi:hypothetical protein D3Y57_09780 [Sphingomonas paeninsulae]|uniref:Uncharacterized protein n=1 Tax=Sphingomonas paeninsulae TaxID=2319844 RepID=A0A494TAW6_SPHPE|nr:hypothetical protein [Sphingomonas paeninsulae]AYJ86200.1 hypothetical protein D3Y57_09780 [Sphingomonas paeninsulae]
MIREPIYAALFDLVQGAPGLVTTSRKLKIFTDVKPNQRPALFQAQKSETAIRKTGFPTVWMIDVTLYIYVSTQGAVSPGEVLNPIMDYLEAQLSEPVPGFSQTLGGLVQWARIEGTTVTSEGTLGNDEISLVPVKILTV